MQLSLDKVSIIYNPDIEQAHNLALEISKNIPNSSVSSIFEMPETPSFVVVVGGDGTLLKCARRYSELDVPLFGFNMGRLGYLAQAKPDEISKVAYKIKNGDFRIEKRIMLYSPTTKTLALNDMVMKGAEFSRTSTLNLYINDIKLCSYLADGLIISTPTGSTAYSLSAGGPIVAPNLECFVVVPICPHTLNARPIVVPSDSKIKITTSEAPKDFQITADGQDAKIIKGSVCIEKSQKYSKLLLLNGEGTNFYDTLREKLHWGIAPNK